jgi:carbon dioxide concentrating mechanism protein CcmO
VNSRPAALGLVEVPFLSITALVCDHVLKSADVHLLGIETTGNQNLTIRLGGEVASVLAALAAAEAQAATLGASAVTRCLSRPEDALGPLLHFPNAQNPLYGGRDQFLPTDYPQTQPQSMDANPQALGIIETQGLTAILEAADTMLKAANVTLVGKEKIGAAYVTVMVRGDVAAVKAAVDAGAKVVDGLGKLIAAHVIARPHDDLLSLLPH